jgi:hypothetical protein
VAIIDLTGRRFGRLTVLHRTGGGDDGQARWRCACDCGGIHEVAGRDLRCGDTTSCGCRKRDGSIRRTHGGYGSRLWRIWSSMKVRCNNSRSRSYRYYGGRGITICPEWLSDFAAFRDWALANGYRDDLTIDRWPDRDGNYEPDNCRWATSKQQRHNRRDSNPEAQPSWT